jgi:hypothetical protein
MHPCFRLCLACCLLPTLVGVAHAVDAGVSFRTVKVGDGCAADETRVCLDTPLLRGGTVTVRDLLSDIYPDLGADGRASRFAGADPVEAASEPDLGAAAERPIDLSEEPAEVAVLEGEKTAYAAAVGSGVVTIAALKPAFRVLGRLYVATDPGGPTDGYRLLAAGTDNPLVVTVSSHFNSQEQYQSLHVVGVVGGEVVDLLDGPYLYSLVTVTDRCDPLAHQETIARLVTLPKAHHSLDDLEIVVDYAATCTAGEQVSEVAAKSFVMRFAYDGTRYVGRTEPLDRLNTGLAE